MDLCNKSVREISSPIPIDCFLFDLNDTLYSSETGIAEALERNIEVFLMEKYGFAEDEASSVRIELYKTYGSTFAGLRASGYDVDDDDYHNFLHERLPYELIKPDPQLRSLLRSIKQRKIIFTNSRKNHAIKVLETLGLQDCFDQIISYETLNGNLSKSSWPDVFPEVLKPSIEAMKIALDVVEVDPPRVLFLDDDERNIAVGKALGLRTVLVHLGIMHYIEEPKPKNKKEEKRTEALGTCDLVKVGKSIKSKEADYVVENVANLAQVIPESWVGGTND